jgi:glycine/D-amino acid oxidase-like deaminating enzyme
VNGALLHRHGRLLDRLGQRRVGMAGAGEVFRGAAAFRDVQVAERWAGYIDATPDAVPVISPVDSIPGFCIATGFSGHGFGIGPGAGKLMPDIVTGVTTPVVDPAPFRYSRFIDEGRLRTA